MIRIAVKSVVVRWSRALGASLAVVVGVGVVSGTLIVSDTADRVGIRNDGLAITRTVLGAAALDQIDGATWVYRALTGLAIMVGLSGIVNVLALSIVEQKRELALLRAIGLDRRQVRTTIRAEATVIATVGVGAGTGLGLLFGWATTRVLEHASQPIRFTLPAGTLAVIALGAIVASLIAAVLPAAWAGRLPLLRTE